MLVSLCALTKPWPIILLIIAAFILPTALLLSVRKGGGLGVLQVPCAAPFYGHE